ncbi:hypothetical protein [Nonomuraea soli]|uniref:Sensor domain-containing protein n=1 Tax=Nonomuraea soli TaxID=1032476 RepID=A0A7W0HTE3_9ACTN|nr:hypothetical protein [Nonomuraea soli]MBA2895043.1 hypothetical protein [Nonomuraea soli]
MNLILFFAVAAGLTIPNGFLLYEGQAAKKDNDPETSWQVSARKGALFAVNPCNRAGLAQKGRAAAKTVVYTAVPDFSKTEQVIVYSSVKAAEGAMGELRAAVRTCAVRKDYGAGSYRFAASARALGDEALAVRGQYYQGSKARIGGERAIVARRANAIVIYTQGGEWGKPSGGDYARQTKDATRMLGKICEIAAC